MTHVKQSRYLILLLAFLMVACQTREKDGLFNQEDKAEIVRLSLERALVNQEVPDYGLLIEQREELILSSENIEDIALPELAGLSLVLLSPVEIQAKADADGDFLYMQFDPFEVISPDEVRVGLGSQWAVAKDSSTGYLSGGGLQMIYTRSAGGWNGEVEAMWIS